MRAARLLLIPALAVAVTGCGRSDPGTPVTPTSTPPATTTATTGTTTTAGPVATPTTAPTTISPSTVQPQTQGARVSVYFVQGEKIVATRRAAVGTAPAAGAVRALLAGPTQAETQAGFTSSVPAGTRLLGVSLRAGTATVDLTGAYAGGGGSLSMLTRLAQVVFTLTQFPSVRDVLFRLDGKPVTAFGGEGVVLDHPVTRADFEDYSPAVLVESPTFGSTVGSPLRIHGTANTFEAVFQLQLVDAAGATVFDQRVMATSGTGTRGTFDVTLRFPVANPGPARLIAWYASPKDGSRVVVATIPVELRR
ncbi:GerMN domain-containing protein [Actinokineospora sp. HUAS TT18]|uniref:GerMN domain-containing protein n=1 Tax=Actinokineospora sp. HUAS TT18 TaxID=3447451 RepID=UPI003F52738D